MSENAERIRAALACMIVGVQYLKTAAAIRFSNLPARGKFLSLVIPLAAIFVGWALIAKISARSESVQSAPRNLANTDRAFSPTPAQWQTLTIAPVTRHVFRTEHVTEGKIAVNEDRSTLIFSPYSGRVTNLLVKPGDTVTRGQLLFILEA